MDLIPSIIPPNCLTLLPIKIHFLCFWDIIFESVHKRCLMEARGARNNNVNDMLDISWNESRNVLIIWESNLLKFKMFHDLIFDKSNCDQWNKSLRFTVLILDFTNSLFVISVAGTAFRTFGSIIFHEQDEVLEHKCSQVNHHHLCYHGWIKCLQDGITTNHTTIMIATNTKYWKFGCGCEAMVLFC